MSCARHSSRARGSASLVALHCRSFFASCGHRHRRPLRLLVLAGRVRSPSFLFGIGCCAMLQGESAASLVFALKISRTRDNGQMHALARQGPTGRDPRQLVAWVRSEAFVRAALAQPRPATARERAAARCRLIIIIKVSYTWRGLDRRARRGGAAARPRARAILIVYTKSNVYIVYTSPSVVNSLRFSVLRCLLPRHDPPSTPGFMSMFHAWFPLMAIVILCECVSIDHEPSANPRERLAHRRRLSLLHVRHSCHTSR